MFMPGSLWFCWTSEEISFPLRIISLISLPKIRRILGLTWKKMGSTKVDGVYVITRIRTTKEFKIYQLVTGNLPENFIFRQKNLLGIYGFGNSPRSNPFIKVQWGLNLFQQTCQKHLYNSNVDEFVEDLTKILTDRRQ